MVEPQPSCEASHSVMEPQPAVGICTWEAGGEASHFVVEPPPGCEANHSVVEPQLASDADCGGKSRGESLPDGPRVLTHPHGHSGDCEASRPPTEPLSQPPPTKTLHLSIPPCALSGDFEVWRAIRHSGIPNFQGCRIPVASALNINLFRKLAWDYQDQQALDFLEFGFPINFDSSFPLHTSSVRNHAGAREFPAFVDQHISGELEQGAIAGPFKQNPFGDCPLVISPLNTVPKDGGLSRRFIMDLSAPGHSGVNAGINRHLFLGEPYRLSLPSVDHIIDCINEVGYGALLFKRDLKKAYRQFPVDPGDWNRLGFKWRNQLYFDKRLTLGLSSAAIGCHRADLLVSFIYSKLTGGSRLVVYLDDFNGVCSPDPVTATSNFEYLGHLLKDLGLAESKNKAVPPATRAVMLGILFDTESRTMQVVPSRLREILTLLQSWLRKDDATKHEVQQLLGKLFFVAKCVRQSRVFLNRLLAFLRSFTARPEANRPRPVEPGYTSHASQPEANRPRPVEPGDKVHPSAAHVGKREGRRRKASDPSLPIPPGARKDIHWFWKFTQTFNGVSIIPVSRWEEPDFTVATDACLVGCGGTCQGEFFRATFPGWVRKNRHISELEILTVCVAAKLWSPFFKARRITLLCDNEASVTAINSGKCRNSTMHACLRELVYVASNANCEFRAVHIEGVSNRLPDYLSRWELGSQYRRRWLEETAGQEWVQKPISEHLFSFSHSW